MRCVCLALIATRSLPQDQNGRPSPSVFELSDFVHDYARQILEEQARRHVEISRHA